MTRSSWRESRFRIESIESNSERLSARESERTPVELQRAVRLGERVEQLSGAARELRAIGVVGVDRPELGRVDLGQAVFGARDLGQPFELVHGRLVRDVLVEQTSDRLERGAVVLLLLFVQLGQPREQFASLFRARCVLEPSADRVHHPRVVGAREVHRLQQRRSVRALLELGRLDQEPLELADRAGMLAIALQRLFQLVEGERDVALVARGNAPDADVQVGGRAQPGVELALIERDQIGPAPRARVQRLEGIDRSALEAQIQDDLVDVDRLRLVVEHVRQQPCPAEHQLLLVVVGLGDVGPALEHLEQALGVAALFVKGLERGQRAALVSAALERLLVVFAGQIAVLQLVASQIGDLQRDGELHLAVEDVGHDFAQQRHVLALATGRGGQPIQMLEPGHEVGVTDRFAHCALSVTERPRRIQERALGHVHRELEARQLLRRIFRSLDLDLEHAQELLEGTLGLEDRA